MGKMSWALSHRGATYNDMYAEVPPESSTFLRRKVYEMIGVSQFEEFERVV